MRLRQYLLNMLVALLMLFGAPAAFGLQQIRADGARQGQRFRGQLGPHSDKIRRHSGRILLWAGPPGSSPSSRNAQWFDFTGAPIPAAALQFGIGKDGIPAIDDPLFVSPDDPRLLQIPHSPYRRSEKPRTNDDIPVIGYADGDEARAYPVALLDRHELVNDEIGGKPVTVGW